MKKGTKIALFASAALASTVLLTACSSSGSGSSSSGKQTITVFSTKTENAATLKELAADFMKANPNITVQIDAPADGGTVLKTDLTKNKIPDVISGGGDANFLMLQKAGVLEDLSSQSYVKNVQDSYKKEVTSMYSDNGLYGVPYSANASGVIYNKDIFTKNNLTAPTTWDEFTKDVATLKTAGVTPVELGFQGADDWTTMCVWNSIAPSLQPADFGANRVKNKATFAADMKPVAQKYLDVLKLAQTNFMGTSYNTTLTDFASGKAAMLINGSWTIPVIKKTNPNINFGIIPFPTTNDTGKNTLTSGIDVLFAVSKSSSHQDADQKFVSFMMEKDNAAKYATEQVAFSTVTGVTTTEPAMQAAGKEIAAGHVSDFPDHLYPAAFQMAGVLSQTSLDFTKGMSDADNVTKTLKAADQGYNTANTK